MYLDEFVEYSNRTFFEHAEPQRYIYGRGFDHSDVEKYSLGYTRFAKIRKVQDADYKALHDGTYKFKLLERRIIIPLRNVIGRVNGLVVRSIEEKRYNIYLMEEAKKIGAFFGLYEAVASILERGRVFVHEAALDSASFAKVFPNTISTLTSFINDEQYEMLRMFADKIILVFDEDGPGQAGKEMLFRRYGNKNFEAISIGYSDSNSCLQRRGVEGFRSYIRKKVPILLQQ
jgi:DNA primase